MSNSISPELTPIDVQAYSNSLLTLKYDEISDLIYYQDKIWFVWQKKSQVGIAQISAGEGGALDSSSNALNEWPLALPYSPGDLDFKIFTTSGGRLITVLSLKASARVVVFAFSASSKCWYLGAYGSATKRFRFHVIERAGDLDRERFDAGLQPDNLLLYTHDGEVYGGFDDTRYHQDDRLRTPEVRKLLDLSFFQKIKVLLPNALPFIFLNSPVAFDEQITDPPGGKAVYLPAHDKRILILYNYRGLLLGQDNQSNPVKLKFKWPGLVIKQTDYYDLVFGVTASADKGDKIPDWKQSVISFRIPAGVLEKSSMQHKCEADMFSCAAGFCKILADEVSGFKR